MAGWGLRFGGIVACILLLCSLFSYLHVTRSHSLFIVSPKWNKHLNITVNVQVLVVIGDTIE